MERLSFPRVPENNWWTLRNQFKKTIPTTVTTSYLKSLLNLESEKSAKNLLPSLVKFGLIDDKNKPTSRANDWRNDAKYKQICTEIISDIYPKELIDLFPDSDVDMESVKNWFMHSGQLGDVAARQNAAMFALLKSGSLEEQKDVKSNQTHIKSHKNTVKTTKSTPQVVSVQNRTEDNQKQKPSQTYPSVHIDLQIHISSDASNEQIDKIFESISRHLYGSN